MSDAESAEKQEEVRGDRVAKVIARAGICSRRDAERLIEAGRVKLNGTLLTTPAVTVSGEDRLEVDGALIPTRERTRLWLFNKPKGLVTTNRDPEGRRTVFNALPAKMPRVLTVGRLDINTEGLLLLTNDGGLARLLELPATGWLRRYRVRAHGRVEQAALDQLGRGVTIDGMIYGAIEAAIERLQGTNIWITVGLREGKNREVKRVMEHLGLTVNRLIRVSYGPFQLGDLQDGEVREVRGRVLRDQLGERLAAAAGADFDADIRSGAEPADKGEAKPQPPKGRKPQRDASPRPGGEPARDGAAAKSRRGPAAPGRAGKDRRDDSSGKAPRDGARPSRRGAPGAKGRKPHADRRRTP